MQSSLRRDDAIPDSQSSVSKKAAQSLGIASLLLVTNYGQFLGGGPDARMHTPFPLTSICMAQISDILLVALLLLAALLGLSRVPGWKWYRLFLASSLPLYILERGHSLIPQGSETRWAFTAAGCWVVTLLLMLFLRPAWYRVTLRGASGFCAFFALFGALSIVQLLWVSAWVPLPHQKSADWQAANQPRAHQRVVWVIFDELSYAQVYERRAPSLALPHFDALAEESTVFTNVQPAGFKTEKILPGLLSGRIVDGLRYSFRNQFSVHHQGLRGWTRLTGSGTLFGDAQRNGWRTAAVGWYNPYCSVYGDALDDCYWMDLDGFDGPMAPTATFRANVGAPLAQMLREFRSSEEASTALCSYDVQNRYRTEVDLQAHAIQMLGADQADFMFVHLGVPHSPNIWNRADASYTQSCGGSYLDSLALADRVLGQIVTTLKASPRWPETTLIVEGDHSWRTEIWDGLPAWTEEDDRASAGGFDPRPALIIHQASQQVSSRIDEAWPLLRVHDVIEGLLTNAKPTQPGRRNSNEGIGPR